jgi:hypothetical protein
MDDFSAFLNRWWMTGADCPSIEPQRGGRAFPLARNLLGWHC